jgi:hypothetical protein
MRDNVQIFLPLILYGIAVVIGLCLCYFVAPRNKRNRWIHAQRAHRWVHRILRLEWQIIRLYKTKVHQRRVTYQ